MNKYMPRQYKINVIIISKYIPFDILFWLYSVHFILSFLSFRKSLSHLSFVIPGGHYISEAITLLFPRNTKEKESYIVGMYYDSE